MAPFTSITLLQLNAKAAMLERRDNKYVVQEAALQQAVTLLAPHFDVLEIDGKRNFTYETRYFDDAQHTNYFDHHRGKRLRCKIRVRRYLDAQTCFVEVKFKDKRGVTVKKRLKYSIDKFESLDTRAMVLIRAAYRKFFGRELHPVLQPVLDISYRRVTLVAKAGGERMTIDSALVFSRTDRSHPINENIFIVETKSANGNGIADKILRGLHQHPTNRCSKYCVGAALLGIVHKHNNFLATLRKFNAAARPGVDPEFGLVPSPRC